MKTITTKKVANKPIVNTVTIIPANASKAVIRKAVNGTVDVKSVAKPAVKTSAASVKVFGRFRPGSKVANMIVALKAKPRTLKEIAKIYGTKEVDSIRPFIYSTSRLGASATPKFSIAVADGIAKLTVTSKPTAKK